MGWTRVFLASDGWPWHYLKWLPVFLGKGLHKRLGQRGHWRLRGCWDGLNLGNSYQLLPGAGGCAEQAWDTLLVWQGHSPLSASLPFLVFKLSAVVTVRWEPGEQGRPLRPVCAGLTGASFKRAFL